MVLEELQKVRQKKNFTYAQMANFLGLSKSYYWQIENGHRNLSYRLAFKIAAIFKLKPDDLFYNNFKKYKSTQV